MFYQGWAEGGNYKIVKRARCTEASNNVFQCAIAASQQARSTRFNAEVTERAVFANQFG